MCTRFYIDESTIENALSLAGFYEWNALKEKNVFTSLRGKTLFMAGIYDMSMGSDSFVIITTSANGSMAPVHDRMPLMFDEDEIEGWLFDGSLTGNFLKKAPELLSRRSEYEQLSLFS